MNEQPGDIGRGEVWLINLDPTIGSEIKKTRPAVVMSSDGIGKLPLKVIVPITEWKGAFAGAGWHVRVRPNAANGLSKESSADALQIRSVSTRRFVKRMGALSPIQVEEVALAIAIVVEI